MQNIVFSPDGILKLLRDLNTQKASGPDALPTRILKETAKEITPALALIFQHSYDTGHVPTDWKNANITAVFKKGCKTDPSNYRPFSLTSSTV